MVLKVSDIRQELVHMYYSNNFSVDKTGEKTIEILGASFLADEDYIFGKPNKEYIKKEIEWYEKQSTNIYDIYGEDREPPKAWKYTASESGEINSNYGYLIWNKRFHNQYEKVKGELKSKPFSRRASMIYTRPSIWEEYAENGKNDFICTNSVTYYVRDDKLSCVVQMRSNDAVYGYKNDYAWQKYVLERLSKDLGYPMGDIYWQVQNFHIYEKHFHLIEKYAGSN